MRRKTRPIWWLMTLGVVATLGLGAWLYFHQSRVIGAGDDLRALFPQFETGPVLDDAREECRLVADYARQKGLKDVSPVLEQGGISMVGGVSTRGIAPLDCKAAFSDAGVVTNAPTVRKDEVGGHAVIFSRVYLTSKTSNEAVFFARDPCPLCGRGWHVDLKRVSGKWVVVGEAEDWVS